MLCSPQAIEIPNPFLSDLLLQHVTDISYFIFDKMPIEQFSITKKCSKSQTTSQTRVRNIHTKRIHLRRIASTHTRLSGMFRRLRYSSQHSNRSCYVCVCQFEPDLCSHTRDSYSTATANFTYAVHIRRQKYALPHICYTFRYETYRDVVEHRRRRRRSTSICSLESCDVVGLDSVSYLWLRWWWRIERPAEM